MAECNGGPAYYGDANLDGVVNSLDLNAVATNFGASSKIWSDGDFTYNGNVDINDFNVLAGNFGQTLPASAPLPDGVVALGAGARTVHVYVGGFGNGGFDEPAVAPESDLISRVGCIEYLRMI